MTKWHIRSQVKTAVKHYINRRRSQLRVVNRHVQLAINARNHLRWGKTQWPLYKLG